MNTITKTHSGHWADHPTGPDASFAPLDDDRSAKGNAPMFLVVASLAGAPLIVIGVISLIASIAINWR